MHQPKPDYREVWEFKQTDNYGEQLQKLQEWLDDNYEWVSISAAYPVWNGTEITYHFTVTAGHLF